MVRKRRLGVFPLAGQAEEGAEGEITPQQAQEQGQLTLGAAEAQRLIAFPAREDRVL